MSIAPMSNMYIDAIMHEIKIIIYDVLEMIYWYLQRQCVLELHKSVEFA